MKARALDGIDHRARSNGSPGKLIEIAAIFFHGPVAIVLPMNHFIGKEGDPVRNSKFDLIAQARRLMMLGDAGTQHGTFKVGGNQ